MWIILLVLLVIEHLILVEPNHQITIGDADYVDIFLSGSVDVYPGLHGIRCVYRCLQMNVDVILAVYPRYDYVCACITFLLNDEIGGNHEVYAVDLGRSGVIGSSCNSEVLYQGVVILYDHAVVTASASPKDSRDQCKDHCRSNSDFEFYYNNNQLCSCDPNLRVQQYMYMDHSNRNSIKRAYTTTDDIYLSCKSIFDVIAADTAAKVWTNKEIVPVQSDHWIAHILPCDMSGGGWTIIQRRVDDAVDFNRGWTDYVNGFGDPRRSFWIGLEAIYQLTQSSPVQLRIELESFEEDESPVDAHYTSFSLEPSSDNYRLRISGYSGTAGDSLDRHDGFPFSTFDADNDDAAWNCAVTNEGGWWHHSCVHANLNGVYLNSPVSPSYKFGIIWHGFKGSYYSLRKAQMSIL